MALAFSVSATGLAFAAPVDVYRGTLGGAEVVMELGKPQAGGVREGRYFYPGGFKPEVQHPWIQ